jgi:hypothetical protein
MVIFSVQPSHQRHVIWRQNYRPFERPLWCQIYQRIHSNTGNMSTRQTMCIWRDIVAGTRNIYTSSVNITKLIPLPLKKRNLMVIRSVGIAPGLDGPDEPVPVGTRFSVPVHTCLGTHPASYTKSKGSFPREKRQRRGVDTHPIYRRVWRKFRAVILVPFLAFIVCPRVNFIAIRVVAKNENYLIFL